MKLPIALENFSYNSDSCKEAKLFLFNDYKFFDHRNCLCPHQSLSLQYMYMVLKCQNCKMRIHRLLKHPKIVIRIHPVVNFNSQFS